MKRKVFILNHTLMLFILAIVTAGCNREKSHKFDENADKELFCSYVSVENIDRTIPIVNEFLSGLSGYLNNDQQLQELTAWLKSQPCIVDAAVFKETPTASEILFLFDESGTTKDLIFVISMTKQLKVIGYREYKKPEIDGFSRCLNVENIDQAMLVINDFLSALPNNMYVFDKIDETINHEK